MNDISTTALTTLKCHEADAKLHQPILGDLSAGKMLEHIRKNYEVLGNESNPKKTLVTHIALRAKYYDNVTQEFIEKHPDATIINIGCGLDNRFERIDNGKINFYDLDLPDIMSVKTEIIKETNRYHQISSSVFDYAWLARLNSKDPVLLLAEGVFMYCPEDDVKSLFQHLTEKFQGFEFLLEVFNSKWLHGWRKKVVEKKLHQELNYGSNAVFQFGIKDSKELEEWSPNLKLVEDWSYLDTNHSVLGTLRYFRWFEYIRKIQWTVHYVLNSKDKEPN